MIITVASRAGQLEKILARMALEDQALQEREQELQMRRAFSVTKVTSLPENVDNSSTVSVLFEIIRSST